MVKNTQKYFWIIGGGILQVPLIKEAKKLNYKIIVTDADENCICKELASCFETIDIFDIDDPDSIELTIDSKIEDYPQWDSLAHINIITQIEAIYSIRFSLEEIEEFEYISVIVQFIASKIQH